MSRPLQSQSDMLVSQMSNDQCPKCDVNFNVNLKKPDSKMSKKQFQRSQFQGPAMVNCSVVHADGSLFYNLPGFFKTIFLRKSLRDWSILQIYHNFDWSHMIALKRLLCLHGFCFTVTAYHAAARCPIDNYCLNGGNCAYYKSIGELVCR